MDATLEATFRGFRDGSKGDLRDRLPKVRFRLSNGHENRTSNVMEELGQWPTERFDSTLWMNGCFAPIPDIPA
jgi:hypothetical protein